MANYFKCQAPLEVINDTLHKVPLKKVCFQVTFEGRYLAALPNLLW